jgi:hypothetical protein
MFNKGFLFKVIFGLIGIAATGVIYMTFAKPSAPTNLQAVVTNSGGTTQDCAPNIQFIDTSQNEDEFRVYRRNLGASAFALIQILPASPGKLDYVNYTDSPLPLGTYEYRVSAYNKFGESYSYIVQAPVVYSTCNPIQPKDPSTLPLNPIIVSLSIINDCNVRISYRDNSTNEQGFKIVRSTTNSGLTIVANLGPHAGIPATYDDKTNLSPGKYYYFINVYNQKGNMDSNTKEIEVTSVCNPTLKPGPTVDALVVPTAQKLSTTACIWQSKANVFLRKGPNVGTYDRLVSVEAGQSFPIIGQSEDGQFWAVEVSPGVAGYITKSENYSLTSGDCSNVPTLKDPPPPVIETTPTKKPAGDNSGGDNNPVPATPCPVGAVCP